MGERYNPLLDADFPDEETRTATLFSHHLIRISELLNRRIAALLLKSEGLKTVEVRILLNLVGEEPVTIADVSRRAGLDKAWISRTVRTLEDKGLVDIASGAHPAAKMISLTPQGKEARGRIVPLLYEEWLMATRGINTRLGVQMLEIVLDNIAVPDADTLPS